MGLIIPTRYVVYYKSGYDGDEGDVTISHIDTVFSPVTTLPLAALSMLRAVLTSAIMEMYALEQLEV